MPSPTIVTVVIVNYNGLPFLKRLLSSLKNQDYPYLETIVIDCHSTDTSVDLIKKYQWLTLFEVSNLGYGQACNFGASHSHGKYLAFLNPDTYLPHNWVSSMLNYWLTKKKEYPHTKIGVIGCQTIGFNQPIPTSPLFTLSKIDIFGNPTDSSFSNPSNESFAAGGIPFFITKSTLNITGGFNKAIFLYGEEIDYSWRLKLFGYHNYICQTVWLYHFGSGSIGKTSPSKIADQLYGCIISSFTNYGIFLLLLILPVYSLYLLGIFSVLPFLTHFNWQYNHEILIRFNRFITDFKSISNFRHYVQSHRKISDIKIISYLNLIPSIFIRSSYKTFFD